MVLLDVNVEVIQALLAKYGQEDPDHFTTTAKHAFVMLKSIVNSTPVSVPTLTNELEALRAYADTAEATVKELRAENSDLQSTVRGLNKALETVSVSSPAGPSKKFEKIELFSGDREHL